MHEPICFRLWQNAITRRRKKIRNVNEMKISDTTITAVAVAAIHARIVRAI